MNSHERFKILPKHALDRFKSNFQAKSKNLKSIFISIFYLIPV